MAFIYCNLLYFMYNGVLWFVYCLIPLQGLGFERFQEEVREEANRTEHKRENQARHDQNMLNTRPLRVFENPLRNEQVKCKIMDLKRKV